MKSALYLKYAILFTFIFSSSCKNKVESTSSNETIINEVDSESILKEETLCYLYAVNNDSIKMKITSRGNEITGIMNYAFFEKDSSFGTLSGIMEGDTLFVNYNFESEGLRSERELALLKKDESYIFGITKNKMDENKSIIDINEPITFIDSLIFKATPCENVKFMQASLKD